MVKARQSCSDEELHPCNPPTLGLDEVDEWTPQRLDDPWKIEPTGIESQFGIADAQPFVHDDGDGHYSYIRQSLSKV